MHDGIAMECRKRGMECIWPTISDGDSDDSEDGLNGNFAYFSIFCHMPLFRASMGWKLIL